MAPWVAMVRGINVGGRNRLAMADLRGLVESLGFGDVRTYLQSGNVVFDAPARSTSTTMAARMVSAIAETFSLDVAVVTRSGKQLEEAIAGNPFVGEGLDPGAEPTLFHVTFLGAAPDPALVARFPGATTRFQPDVARVVGNEVYLHIPGGYGDTKLHNAFVEKALGVVATTRNWRSALALADLATGGGH